MAKKKKPKSEFNKVTPTMVFLDKWLDDEVRELYFGPMNKVHVCAIGKRPFADRKKSERIFSARDDRFINNYNFTARYEFVGFL